ncbi:MAG: sensor histidine kinase [Bacteroidota bacterium]
MSADDPPYDNHQSADERQRLLNRAYQLADIGNWEYDMASGRLYWSDNTKRVHGFDPDHVPDVESTIELFKEGVDRDTFRQAAMNAIEQEQPFDVELRIISGKGDERWIRAIGHPEYENGRCVRFFGISQNITQRRIAEEELKKSEKRFRSLVQDGSDLIAILDTSGLYTYVSPTAKRILGIPPEAFIGTHPIDYIHPDDRDRITSILQTLGPGDRVSIQPFRFRNHAGEWKWIETTITNLVEDPSVQGIVANSRDVTQKILREQQLQEHQEQILENLREKETLLSEIHHRVKNNLAVISGMMQLQAFEAEQEVRIKLMDGISRIQTMALIHEQLYQSTSFSTLDFSDNIETLVRNILKTMHRGERISLELISDPLSLNINQAVPCSLIVNEVVTNAIKHAFPEQSEGTLLIRLTAQSGGYIHLEILDDGVGFPDGQKSISSQSLGMHLIDVLARQIQGVPLYQNRSDQSGTRFTLKFPLKQSKGPSSNLVEEPEKQ